MAAPPAHRAWPSRSTTATGTTALAGRRASRLCSRPGCWKGRPCVRWAAITSRRRSIRTAGLQARRSPNSSSRRSANCSDEPFRVTAPVDPYRTLGLPRDAPLLDVKRAYRRLAKLHHPDSAGPAALPRFLAIHAAYEAITGLSATGHAPQRPATARPTPPAWAADAERARAARSRGRSARSTGPDRRGTTSDGSSSDRTGSDRSGSDRSRSDRPGSERRAGGSRGRGDRAGGRATLGSTSYDGADEEPFEPDWAGGSWYGAGSGTYWRVNPKEYADPRKHGPEYQARGRRRPESAAGRRAGPDGSPAETKTSASSGASSSGSWTEASNPHWSAGSGAATGRPWTDVPRDDAARARAPEQSSWADDQSATNEEEGAGGIVPTSWFSLPVPRPLVPIMLLWPPIIVVLAALLE